MIVLSINIINIYKKNTLTSMAAMARSSEDNNLSRAERANFITS